MATPGPGVRERPPRREGGLSATQAQGVLRCCPSQDVGPGGGTPLLARRVVQMSGDKRRFWGAQAEVLESWGDGEDGGDDAAAVVNHLLDHGRAPAGPAKPRLDRPLVQEGGEGGLRRRGQVGRAAGRLGARCTFDAIGTAPASPGGDGLLLYAQDHGHLRETPAVPNGENGEERLDLASVTLLLGCLQSAFHNFTGELCEGKTDAAHRDMPPTTTWERCGFGRPVPDVWRRVNPTSENLFLKVYSTLRVPWAVFTVALYCLQILPALVRYLSARVKTRDRCMTRWTRQRRWTL
jgi:hypothetical protein